MDNRTIEEIRKNETLLIEEIKGLIEENQELKKQLHEASLQIQSLIEEDMTCPSTCSKLRKLRNQQKEFIEWLEKETKIIENKLNKYNELVKQGKETDIEYYLSIIDERIFDVYGKILSKYKEITGGNNDQ